MSLRLVSGDVSTSRHQPGPVALQPGGIESETEGAAELVRGERRLAVVEAGEEPAAVLGVGVVTWKLLNYFRLTKKTE